MSDSKRTKRIRDGSEEMTLDNHIAARRKCLVDARMQAPTLKQHAESIRRNAEGMICRFEKRMKADLIRHACLLEEEASIRESMAREHTFEKTVVSYLRMYNRQMNSETSVTTSLRKTDTIKAYVKHSDVSRQRREIIVDEYLTEMNNAPPKVAMAVCDECPLCPSGVKFLLCCSKSIMSCPECGYSVTYLDATNASTSFDDVVEFSQYSYKRVNHYMMWLSLLQGKEAHRVPDDTLNSVMEDLYERQGINNCGDVTPKRVRDSLRKLKLRKAYDHVTQITARISGVKPPRITAETEEKLKNMFLQMQPIFQRHAPKTRTNFLSYSYVLYRCFQILGLSDMLEGITLLKGRDKLEANDSIFRSMSIDLGWPVFDLPPASETTL